MSQPTPQVLFDLLDLSFADSWLHLAFFYVSRNLNVIEVNLWPEFCHAVQKLSLGMKSEKKH